MTQPRFLAFILANEQEEFLHDYDNSPGAIVRAWTVLPQYAKRFPTRRAAEHAVRRLEAEYPVYVVEFLDDGDRFIVTADEAFPRPSWLAALH
jgi:hypothetical protein